MLLSILICHLKSRDEVLKKLESKIMRQVQACGEAVELLVETDCGETAIGRTRNVLLRKARGEYICFIDDDDDIADNYLSLIIDALKEKPDCAGICGMFCRQGKAFPFRHSIQFQGWYTGKDAFYRTPNHLNPVKRNIALKVMFSEINNGEDRIYSDNIKWLLKTEKYIEQPIYIYNK